MRVLIVEDEPMAAERLQQLVLELEPSAHVLTRLDSVKQTVNWLKSNQTPDLILLDIQLADGISFQIVLDVLNQIEKPLLSVWYQALQLQRVVEVVEDR